MVPLLAARTRTRDKPPAAPAAASFILLSDHETMATDELPAGDTSPAAAEPPPAAAEPTPASNREPDGSSTDGAHDPVAPSSAVSASAPASSTDPTAVAAMFAFLRGGHPMRWLRGGTTFGVGALVTFLLMAHDVQWRWAVPVGFVFVIIAALGALDIFGGFDDLVPWQQGAPQPGEHDAVLPPARVADRVANARDALPMFVGFLITLLVTMAIMSRASGIGWGLALVVGWTAVAATGFTVLAKLGIVDAATRPLRTREGFWLVVFCAVIFLPTLGVGSLVDPWETHYGEVSREVLSRDDWITIWWAEEGYFLSKPILDFWMQALAMATFGVDFHPGRLLAPSELHGAPPHPEWIVRLPSLALSVIALYLAYKAVSKTRGRRAGLIGAMVLATMCDWMMLSHQSITDMPFVASLTAAMSLLIIGLGSPDEETVRAVPVRFGKSIWTLSGWHVALGVVLLCALPQAFYLISRNFELITQGDFGFAPRLDEYHAGSGGMCWMGPEVGNTYERLMRVGKWPCDPGTVVFARWAFQPAAQGLLWLACLGALLFINRNERRVSRLCFIVAWVFAGISTMGKGVAGFLLPIAVAGSYILAARKWRDILRLELVSGVIVLATVAAPWFIAMYTRMGDEFIQQLFVHHMWKRALDHVHDTNTGDDVSLRYYVWQLGYAMFPWIGLVPAGLVWWARTRWQQARRALTVEQERQRDAVTFLVMWFVIAFGLFTYMKTKFHHYVFPAVPPAALLTGLYLDEALGKRPLVERGSKLFYALLTLGGVALAVVGFSMMVPGPLFGRIPLPTGEVGKRAVPAEGWSLEALSAQEMYQHAQSVFPAAPKLGAALGLVGLVLIVAAAMIARKPAPTGATPATSEPSDVDPITAASDELDLADDARLSETSSDEAKAIASSRRLLWGAVALAGAVTVALVTRDLASRPDLDIKGQERLIQLFTYRYDRSWPKDLLFQPALLGFGLTATLLTALMFARHLRRQAVVALVALAGLWAIWDLDVYMPQVSEHWGQRPIFDAYYRDRDSDQEPLVAFEMNWKGENFYSGGRLIEFGNSMSQGRTAGERGSDRMRQWLNDIKGKTKAIYIVTESGRQSRVDEMFRSTFGPPPKGKWLEPVTTEKDGNKFQLYRARVGR